MRWSSAWPLGPARKAERTGPIGQASPGRPFCAFCLAMFAVRIFHITGLLAAGGLLLLWVAWKMVREVQRTRHMRKAQENSSPLEGEVRWGGERLGSSLTVSRPAMPSPASPPLPHPLPQGEGSPARAIVNEAYILESSQRKKLSGAILQIAIADISMSLDNVLAVAGVARDHLGMLALGLALSVMLMGMAAGLVAKLTERHPWIAHLGIAVVLYTAVKMMGEGGAQFFHH